MEIMFIDKSNELFKKNKFTAIYKDKSNLINNGVDLEGISFDDNWKVKRFLNGYKLTINPNIYELFEELDIDLKILNKKLYQLSSGQLKLILFVYSMLQNKDIILLDYFDKGLDLSTKNKIINYLKRKYNKTLVVISNDIIFLNKLCSYLIVYEDDKIVFNDEFKNVYKVGVNIEMPEIIKFINLVNKGKNKLNYTVDNKELLKDIYRSVK